MAENIFWKIDDIPGESTEKNHKDWIPCKSLTWSVERTLDMTDLGTTQRGFANANFGKVELTTELSKASPKIMTAVANGTVRKEMKIEMCRSGDSASQGMEAYLTYTLKDSTIDSYNVSGGEEQIPEETSTVTYRSISIKYKQADYKTGKLGDPVEFKWNLETGDVS